MQRPTRFEDHRWLGDKRTQVVYDVDACDDPAVIAELLAADAAICFAPDTIAEARNRGYRPHRRWRRRRSIGGRAHPDAADASPGAPT